MLPEEGEKEEDTRERGVKEGWVEFKEEETQK